MDYGPDVRSTKQIELDNYLTTIMELSKREPGILYRLIELTREENKRNEGGPKK